MFWKTVKINKADFGVITAVLGGVFLLLELVISIIMVTVRPDSVPTLAGTMLPFMAGFLGVFVSAVEIPMCFEFMLRYSVTRRGALAVTLGLIAVEVVYSFGLAVALAQLERALVYGIWLRVNPALAVEEFGLPLWGVALGAAGVLLLGLICGTVLQRFGRKAMVILWVLWMAVMLLMQSVDWDKIFSASLGGYIPLAAVLLVLSVLSVWSLMRATVKN